MAHKQKQHKQVESDGAYFLKILMYLIIGLIWIKLGDRPVVPVGLLLGILFSSHDHFRIDRKVEYAVLLVASLLAFVGIGLFLSLN